MTVVKSTEAKFVQIMIQNRDRGRIKEGQSVQIKYDAYPYQEWNIYEGKVTHIADRPSEVKGQESTYEVRVDLNAESRKIKKGTKEVELTLGLQGFAEIITVKKQLIETIFTHISRLFMQVD